jgi:hypothetical protein
MSKEKLKQVASMNVVSGKVFALLPSICTQLFFRVKMHNRVASDFGIDQVDNVHKRCLYKLDLS